MAADHDRASFGATLRRFRITAGLSQEALAERAGLSAQAIGALETGKRRRPYPHTVAALADALALTDAERAELAAARGAPRSTSSGVPPRLPQTVSPLVGRDEEVRVLAARLRDGQDRLVTLTGPGGVGKTSLALAVAADVADDFADDVVFVSLGAIADPGLIPFEVAAALGLAMTSQQQPDAAVRHALRSRRLLLILDNLEHLPAAAIWVSDLLAVCLQLTVLATSRAPLRIQGEREYLVQPLLTPEITAQTGLDDIAAAPAVRLFVERSTPGSFALTEGNAAAVAAVCQRVDGLPLAIELAAARVRILSPDELLARLDRMMPVLAGGPRDRVARLQSMNAAIGWSYDLLNPDEQALLRRLAVFAGGFTLDAAEVMLVSMQRCSVADGGAPYALDIIASLVDKSLLQRADDGASVPRFTMLMTIQAYALEQLSAAAETASARHAHAEYMLALAEQAWPAFRRRAGQESWLNRLEAERANLRGALVWLEERGDHQALLRLTGALAWFWYIRGPLTEGRSWLERALAVSETEAPGEVHARAAIGLGLLAHFQGEDDVAETFLESGLAVSRNLDDPWLPAFALLLLGMVAEDRGEYRHAETHFLGALERFRAADDRSNAALALIHLGVVAWGRGDVEHPPILWREASALQRAEGNEWGLSISLGYLGLLLGERGEVREAALAHRESLQLRWDVGIWEDIAASLGDLATLAAAADRPEAAARLFGAAAGLREATGRQVLMLPERAVFERAEQQARATLGPAAFAAAENAGRSVPIERIVAEAIALADEIAGMRDVPCSEVSGTAPVDRLGP